MTTEVVPLAPGQWRQAAIVMARAFAKDPLFAHMFPNLDRHDQALNAWMACGTRIAETDGNVELTAGGSGVACWFTPNGRQTLASALRTARPFLDLVRAASPREIHDAFRWLSRWEQRRLELAPGPH